MTRTNYKVALETAQKDLADLLEQQKRIEEDILIQRRLISSLMERVQKDETQTKLEMSLVRNWNRYLVEQEITEDIRKLIRAAGDVGLPKELIRSELSKIGNSIESHSNPSGTVNAVIKRLIEKEEVEEHTNPMTGYKTIRWKEKGWGQLFLEASRRLEQK